MAKKPVVTDQMVDAELERQSLNRQAGVIDIEGKVDAKLSIGQLFAGVLAANLATAVVVGIVVLLITL
ncbi:hypothetical protein JTZ10_21730 [Gordonia rubripertincta]|uniref:Uncharacterized protein n=1 Tax=Gordonia rubripertincta TaxID=36822 RepID=A0AAW4GAJ6_GORRU|nr:hypothetical protein [Gordonia rubripertincta]MBM7280369.1 hypothetical protein [Gordonia rubripertincta]